MQEKFNLQKFIAAARNGEKQSIDEFIDYCREFEAVVLWGAGNLGKAVGQKMISSGFTPDAYWDIQANSIGKIHNIPCIPPFTGEFSREKTLVIFCIGNVAVSPNIFRQLSENDWNHVIHGNDFLQGLLCPLTNDHPPDTKICNSFDICSVCSCERLNSIVRINALRKKPEPADEALSFDRVHFIVNNVCNLKCTHCFLFINSYPKELKQNVRTEQLLSDIDQVMSAISSFGVVNVFGGEPFMHKDIDKAIEKILSHENFGALLLNTNGIQRIKPKHLTPLANPRVRLAFSNYLEAIDESKKAIFFENLEQARSMGIEAKYQNSLPTWNLTSTLHDLGDSQEVMEKKKRACGVRFLYVFDGKIFPCAFSLSIYDLRVADYHGDYVQIDPNESHKVLRQKIRAMIERPHYQSCGHCESFSSPALVKGAAEQGYSQRYALPNRPRRTSRIIPIASQSKKNISK